MKRVFVALPLPDDVRSHLAALGGGLGGPSAGVLWADAINLHLTLRFVGDVDGAALKDLEEGLETISVPSFRLKITGLGQFGDDNPRILWAGVDDDGALEHLQKKVETAVVRSGFKAEKRKFSPHVTLARMRRVTPEEVARFIESRGIVRAGPVFIDRFQLVQSLRGENGPLYRPLRDYPLAFAGHDFSDEELAEFDQEDDLSRHWPIDDGQSVSNAARPLAPSWP